MVLSAFRQHNTAQTEVRKSDNTLILQRYILERGKQRFRGKQICAVPRNQSYYDEIIALISCIFIFKVIQIGTSVFLHAQLETLKEFCFSDLITLNRCLSRAVHKVTRHLSKV